MRCFRRQPGLNAVKPSLVYPLIHIFCRSARHNRAMEINDLPMTRRRILAVGAAGALTIAMPGRAFEGIADAGIADPNAPVSGPALEPEIVTVTESTFVAWWRTDTASDTTMVVEALTGPDKGRKRRLKLAENETIHCAKVTGLRPGTRYRYEMWSGGQMVSTRKNLEADPGELRTLVRPKGRLLARVAVLNDLHVGESCSGTISGTPENSFPPCYTVPDYAYKMVDAALNEVADIKADLLVANGDLTDRGRDADMSRALARLKKVDVELMVTRGNHDRRMPGDCAPDGDCMRAQYFPEQSEGDSTTKTVKRIGGQVAVIGMDSCHPDTGKPRLDLGDQPAWLESQLTKLRAEGRIVIVAFHHPMLVETTPPQISERVKEGAPEIMAILARHSHVKLVINGHSHRNNLGFDPVIGPRLPFLENGAVKEYPAGYAVLDVYETGIMRTFHRPDTTFSREWVNISAKQVFGNHPQITRGSLGSRAFVTNYSKKGLANAESATRGDTGLRAEAPKRIRIMKLLDRGLPIEIDGYAGAPATARLVAKFHRDGASETVLLASARRNGSGRLRLKVDRRARKRLGRLKKGRQAILQVTSSGRIYEQAVKLTRG